MSRPASAAALRELLRVIGAALDLSPDDQPGSLLMASSAVWAALKTLAAHDFDADAVQAATRVLRALGGGSPGVA